MKRRKILMVLNRLDIGGAETHVVDLASALQQMGWDVMVASGGGVFEETLRELGIRHDYVPADARNLARMRATSRALEQIIRTERPDVVHAHARIPAFLCGRLQKKIGFPLVTTAHWTFEVNSLLRAVSNWGQQTIAVSEDIRDYLINNYPIAAGRIHVIPNGINTRRFCGNAGSEAVRAELEIPEDAEIVTCVTRLHTTRAEAAWLLTRIAPELAAARPGVRILIVGDGECLPSLREEAARVNKALGYPCLLLPGGRTDIPEILSATDVFVGVSRAAMEAMSCRKPVILCGNEGYGGIARMENAARYMATNYCCRDYPKSTPEALEQDILSLLQMDSRQRAVLGEDGRRVVLQDFSEQAMVQQTIQVYDRAMHPRKSVVVSGYYGYGNMGDDAILQQICRKYGSDCDLVVLSRHPEETEQKYRVTAINRFSPMRVCRELKHCDALLSGGGSLLQDHTSSRSLWYYLWVLRKALRYGKRVVVYANGVGPISHKHNQKLTARTLAAVDSISVRDEESERVLRRIGVQKEILVTADPVFEMEAQPEAVGEACLKAEGIPMDRPLIAVALRDLTKKQCGTMAGYLDAVCRENRLIPVFFCMQEDPDRRTAQQVAALMQQPAYILQGIYSAEQTIAMMGHMRLAVGMRLHMLIFAAVAGVPIVGFSVDPKLESLLEETEMPKLEKPEELQAEKAVRITSEVLAHRDEYAGTLSRHIAEQRLRANRNDQLFRKSILREGVRKRIAFFQSNLHVGGIQKALVNSVMLPTLQDCDIDLYLFDQKVFFDISALPKNVSIHYLKPFPVVTKLLPFWLVHLFSGAYPIDGWFDAAVDFDSYQHDCAHGALSVRSDRRIMWIHNDMEIKLREEPKYRILFRFMKGKYRKYTHFAAVSEGIVEPFRNCTGMLYSKVAVVPNLINTEEIFQKSEEPPEMQADPSRFNVVSVGRLCHQKGYDLMLRDMQRLCRMRPETMCYLIGDGPDRAALQKQAEQLGIRNHVIFTGNLPNPYPMMRQMDAFCLESRYEGQGIVFWEAKALGLPLYFPRRLEKYNPSLQGSEDVAEALAAAEKQDQAQAPRRFDALTMYNHKIEESLCKLLGVS
ncbi:MAG: polysaccharide pyruvyl transferase CsaB [Oscillospiraceae bacterium]|nr:polysaccharide pyruvyl transferase CsaB [Oscillospiraceae bacterium]